MEFILSGDADKIAEGNSIENVGKCEPCLRREGLDKDTWSATVSAFARSPCCCHWMKQYLMETCLSSSAGEGSQKYLRLVVFILCLFFFPLLTQARRGWIIMGASSHWAITVVFPACQFGQRRDWWSWCWQVCRQRAGLTCKSLFQTVFSFSIPGLYRADLVTLPNGNPFDFNALSAQ